MKHLILVFAFLSGIGAMQGQPLEIVAPTSKYKEAKILQDYLHKITGQSVPIVGKMAKRKAVQTIFMGASKWANAFGFSIPANIPPDAYFLEGKNGAFAIDGGGELGTENGVYSLLELLGCRKYSPRDSFIPEIKDLKLPVQAGKLFVPAFPYRELWYEPAFDEGWARWHKLKTNLKKNEEWGMFVHTFDKLCPRDLYFKDHQNILLSMAPSVRRAALSFQRHRQANFNRQPAPNDAGETLAKYWSVSQNDNYDYCKCSRCAASDKLYGGPAGTLIAFVNKIAAEFPNKTISTLAYQYTRQAPRNIRPASNVSICLCSIECNRGQSIEDGCTDFAGDVRAWGALTGNLMIWDYVVQFRSYVSPFPNWHTLQPNLQFFQKNGVKMMFEQGSGHSKSEFSDMRAYLLAKLMWNPDANMDSILLDFGTGYYGKAQPYVQLYIQRLTTQVQNMDRQLGIYATPQMEMNSFLNHQFLGYISGPLFYGRMSLKHDSLAYNRIKEASLPMMFAILEMSKSAKNGADVAGFIQPDGLICDLTPNLLNYGLWNYNADTHQYEVDAYVLDYLNEFVEGCQKAGLLHLHEMGYSVEQYKDYLKFLHTGYQPHKARNRPVQLANGASQNYERGDPQVLTDGYLGTEDYHFNWLGFNGNDLVATVAVKDTAAVGEISVQFLQDQQSWVFFPERVSIEVSSDGEKFEPVYEETISIVSDGKKSVHTTTAKFSPRTVRAVRVTGQNIKKCPSWHNCNGNPCWIFVDEVVVGPRG